MKNRNAFVGFVRGVSQTERGYRIDLEGDRSARIEGDRAGAQARLLEQLQRDGKPVYLDIDPETAVLRRIHIPVIVRVQDVVTDSSGDVRVRLQRSHAMPGIGRNDADYGEVVELLRAAKAEGGWLALTADGPNLIDVRPWKPPGAVPPRVLDELPRPALRWWESPCWPWNWRRFSCVTARRAKELFDLCAAQSCNPLTVPVPCIPFLYPEDGCWARASEMCRLMIQAGANPRKIWIDGTLHAATKNSPYCGVNWGWHVAPILCVRRWWWWPCRCFFFTYDVVIDPSLFAAPVTSATWKGVQGDPSATLTITPHTYYASWHPSDPTYTETNSDLATYRGMLQARSLGPDGPPPYAQCP
jgi:hypothetical protein